MINDLSNMEKENSKKRLEYIDAAKCIGIFLMVLGHTAASRSKLGAWIFSFHMPLFFILNGYVNKNCSMNFIEFKAFLIKQIKAYIIPYLLFALINCHVVLDAHVVEGILYGSRNSLLLADTSSALWFLPTLFLANIFYQMIVIAESRLTKKYDKKQVKIAIFFVIITLLFLGLLLDYTPNTTGYRYFLGVDIALVGLFFIYFGSKIKSLLEHLLADKSNLWTLSLSFLLFILGVITMFMNNDAINSEEFFHVSMALGFYGNNFFFLLSALCTSTSIILISNYFTFKIFTYIGANTLLILGMQDIVLNRLNYFVTEVMGVVIDGSNYILVSIEITIIALLILTFFMPLVNYFAPNLVGKKG